MAALYLHRLQLWKSLPRPPPLLSAFINLINFNLQDDDDDSAVVAAAAKAKVDLMQMTTSAALHSFVCLKTTSKRRDSKNIFLSQKFGFGKHPPPAGWNGTGGQLLFEKNSSKI